MFTFNLAFVLQILFQKKENINLKCKGQPAFTSIEEVRLPYEDTNIQFFVEDGTVEFSNNSLSILSSTILDLKDLSKEKISNMIEESKTQLNDQNLDDKKRYIASHKIDCLSRINL